MDVVDLRIGKQSFKRNTIAVGRAGLRKKKSPLKKFVRTPKGILFFILLALTLIGTAYPGGLSGFRHLILGVMWAVFLDFIITYLLNRPLRFPDGALITGLIIGGIMSTSTPWYYVLFTVFIAILSKHLIKQRRKPIFNPAATGLLISATFFSTGESWWSSLSMLPVWLTLFLLVGGFIIANRLNKLPLVFSFLGTYALLFLVSGLLQIPAAGDAIRPPYSQAALFLGFFMLTDPPTSPAKIAKQIVYGVIAACIGGFAFFRLSKLSFLLVGLLAANAWKAADDAVGRRHKQVKSGSKRVLGPDKSQSQ
jgi:Na+-translocating ferredoxin:NAD+ oxidoreductase RnfD subunit